MSQWLVLCLILQSLCPPLAAALPLSQFYPFNTTVGDNQTEKSDDGGSGKINLSQRFPFFGKRHDKLYVNNNGVISFFQELRTYRPSDFPLKDPTPIVAPYWADVDVDKVGGVVYYRETTNADILSLAEEDVRTYSSSYRKFIANWAFIATWYDVGYYGATGSGKDKRNTFQCVLVSDGTLSFVIINYHQIEWTTGSNSNGTPETGLGGNPAQAGFNAGDAVNFYEIEGARTTSVINLTKTSNVCIPGRWIFRVDSPAITGNSGKLYTSPSSGSMLGGYDVAITGPCFEAATLPSSSDAGSSVQGFIEETNTTFPCTGGTGTGLRTVQCVMPTVFAVGPVTVSVIVNGQKLNYTGEFTLVNAAQLDADVKRHSPQNWTTGRKDLRVSWKQNLFSENQTVEVEVMTYRNDNNGPRLEVLQGTNFTARNNDQKVDMRLPSDLPIDVTLAVVRVKVSHALINDSYLSHWSDVFPVRWSDPAKSDDWCARWLDREQRQSDQLEQQPPCPCTLNQAESDTGRWQRDPLCSSESTSNFNCVYRGANAHECILPNYNGEQSVNQVCCYGNNKELLDVRERGGGSTLERLHYRSRGNQIVPWFSYIAEDVAPFLHCCEYSSDNKRNGLCDSFQLMRAPVSCQGYNPPAAAQAAGDPHLVTLDGLNYTFNGEGDFVLIQDHADPSLARVKVHVHASRVIDIDDVVQNATVFTAVAMQVANETATVEIKLHATEVAMLLIDQQQVDITSWPHEVTGMTIYRNQASNGTVEFTVVMETVGISVLVSADADLLNIMMLVGSSDLKGNLTGLLGNYNGVKEDDLRSRDGQILPANSTMREVHYGFGMTWFVNATETLLYHSDVAFSDAEQPVAQSANDPVFIDELQGSSRNNSEMCEGNLQCLFDLQLTNNPSIAESMKKFNDRFQEVVKDTAPVVRCPFVDHIANGSRQLEGQAVGNKAIFGCEDNFKANGTTTLECLSNGTWSGPVPDCVQKVPIGPDTKSIPQVYYAVGGGLGGFVFLVVLVFLAKYLATKYARKNINKQDDSLGETDGEHIELPVLFQPSDIPNPVFDNPRFLDSLQKLKPEGGKFHIPRPRFVDPNIFEEYF